MSKANSKHLSAMASLLVSIPCLSRHLMLVFMPTKSASKLKAKAI